MEENRTKGLKLTNSWAETGGNCSKHLSRAIGLLSTVADRLVSYRHVQPRALVAEIQEMLWVLLHCTLQCDTMREARRPREPSK
jgi:hypothetical protein